MRLSIGLGFNFKLTPSKHLRITVDIIISVSFSEAFGKNESIKNGINQIIKLLIEFFIYLFYFNMF